MYKNTKSGQYAPKQNDFPKPEPMTPSYQSTPASTTSQQGSPTARPSPVKATAVADATMQRADEYAQQKMDEISKKIKDFGDSVAKIPKDVPVNLPEDVDKKLNDFKNVLKELNERLKTLEGIKGTINGWLVKGLGFLFAIASLCILITLWTSVKFANANQRFEEADKKWQDANAVVLKMDSIQKERDIRHDFGEWMIRRHGEYGNEYSLFKQENKYRKKW